MRSSLWLLRLSGVLTAHYSYGVGVGGSMGGILRIDSCVFMGNYKFFAGREEASEFGPERESKNFPSGVFSF